MNQSQDTLVVQRGECLRANIEYTNEDGTPLDLSTSELTCPAASHDALKDGVVLTFTDAAKGKATIYVPSDVMDTLPSGRASWLRLANAQEEETCLSISMKLWVEIQ